MQKNNGIVLSLVFITTLLSCGGRNETTEHGLNGLPPEDNYYPETNCTLKPKVIDALKKAKDESASMGQLVAIARSFVPDSIKNKYDTLWAVVKFEFTSPSSNKTIRVNGYTVYDEYAKIPLFSDSLCLWLQAKGTQGKLAGKMIINEKEVKFSYDPYSSMSIKSKIYTLKEFSLKRAVRDTLNITTQPIASI